MRDRVRNLASDMGFLRSQFNTVIKIYLFGKENLGILTENWL